MFIEFRRLTYSTVNIFALTRNDSIVNCRKLYCSLLYGSFWPPMPFSFGINEVSVYLFIHLVNVCLLSDIHCFVRIRPYHKSEASFLWSLF